MTGGKPTLPAARPEADYEVGYGKPPVASRFAKGQSGNPKGRPRGAKSKRPALNEERLKDIILDEAYRDITVRDGGRSVTVPMAQAIVRAMAVNAAKGQHRAQRLFAEMLAATERQNKALSDEWLETAITYKVEWDQELARRERLGITDLPAPLPHPDQVKIDMETGRAWIDGPATKEQVAQLEVLQARREDWLREVEGLEQMLMTENDEAVCAAVEEDLARTRETLAIIDRLLG
ncbi:DUF5681 domain-containing protein [uncultured Maritimibacter sp.]|uniref:DUF5681 domain-containing protein n=1 Tax=uncultured Maritimibacter sp. TaxID=991866 RepID=UPI0030DAE851|tara:strand:+ start:488 stop:1192 length:705 start_codon:yes stop_codon:yes gene_type:complete